MAPTKKTVLYIALIISLIAAFFPASAVYAGVPVTADVNSTSAVIAAASSTTAVMPLSDFASAVNSGYAGITGVYVDGTLANKVIQQPAGNNGFVSTAKGVLTQFNLASQYGNIGLLGHNFAAGQQFFKIQPGNIIHIIYGNGEIKSFAVTSTHEYQALSPASPTSDFIDLESNERLTSTQLFKSMYAGSTHLTLQTCIAMDNEPSWGRLFVIAEPVD